MSTVTNSDIERAPENSGASVGNETLLEVRDLKKYFPVKSGGVIRRTVAHVQAVDGVSFSLNRGESLGLVGESGCGKTTTGRLITRLYDPTAGEINFEGNDIGPLTRRQMMPIRSEIQMIFQDPYSSLNPRHTVGTIVGTPLRVHNMVPEKKTLSRVQELLEVVGLNPEHYNRYPSEFSGGQRQRIGIARALALQPKLLVADEPVSALDVSIQAQVVNLLGDVQEEFGIAFLFIAHDLAIVRHFCPDVAVMYLGKIVEIGDRETIYEHPHHPYTQALLSAAPDVKQAAVGGRRERIRLEGDVPSPINPPRMDSAPPSWNNVAYTDPIWIAVGSSNPIASALAWNSRGRNTSEPNTSCAVSPCHTSQTLVRRCMITGRSARLMRYPYSSPWANTPASCGSLWPRRMLYVNRYATVAATPTTVIT